LESRRLQINAGLPVPTIDVLLEPFGASNIRRAQLRIPGANIL